jgi:hypothetical protein
MNVDLPALEGDGSSEAEAPASKRRGSGSAGPQALPLEGRRPQAAPVLSHALRSFCAARKSRYHSALSLSVRRWLA